MYRTLRQNPLLLAALVASSSVLLPGCGLLDGLPSRDARCEMRPETAQCTDLRGFKGPTFITFENVCDTLAAVNQGGVFEEDARCDVTGSVGGCQAVHGDGSEQTNWYFPPKYTSEADVKEECAGGQGFVPPTP
ncbi:hypothetical protein [Archangium violaceum]|uniref:hypothetical protein n=1 Tax=Archangium violaceum TaxID=83451 RepID=UPI0036D815B9